MNLVNYEGTKNYAIVSGVIAYNFKRNGFAVTTYNKHLIEICDWFPELSVKNFLLGSQVDEEFAQYDGVLSIDGALLCKINHHLQGKYHIFYERDFDRRKTIFRKLVNMENNAIC